MFVVNIRYIGYLDVYISEVIYIPLFYNSSLYRTLRYIYARYIGYLQHTKTISALPVELKKAISYTGRAGNKAFPVPV